jgi:hypothetical protein
MEESELQFSAEAAPGVFHHFVPEQVFRRVETPINYAYPA